MAPKRPRQDSKASTTSTHASPNPGAHTEDPPGHTPKYLGLESSQHHPRPTHTAMRCSLPPHDPLTFPHATDYENHYHTAHTNRCTECQRNLPTAHFLSLHISENHDPILAARSERGEKVFGCFVEGCEKVCADWRRRRRHLVDKHGFPRNYDFLVVNSGVDGRRSMLRAGVDALGHRRNSRGRERRGSEGTGTTEGTEVSGREEELGSVEEGEAEEGAADVQKPIGEEGKPYVKMDDLVGSMSSLQFVPRSVTFGRRKGKAGFAKS